MSEQQPVTEELDDEPGESSDEVKSRQRSTIAFPYSDYEGAAEVAAAIHGNVGHGTCSLPQLAAWMDSSVKSSSFRTLISAARLFGLIDSDNAESYRLTDLGTRLADPKQLKAAQAEAFLRVPLFAALFEKYKHGVTPPSAALEREIASLGVSEKQKTRARQVFESSAQQTGFRQHGPNRLVMPAVAIFPTTPQPAPAAEPETAKSQGGGISSADLDLDPLLIALLQKIPANGQPWPKDRRVRWFRTFAMNVSEVYDAEDDPVELEIQAAKEIKS
jgi:hypothetical protein